MVIPAISCPVNFFDNYLVLPKHLQCVCWVTRGVAGKPVQVRYVDMAWQVR